ncbi:MAG TPA: ABC transporter permease [Longimicrobiales bacterium]|nr:ABC transporter permease [Longimicrobiales bacterium]
MDGTGRPGRGRDGARWLYRSLLFLYPRDFRERYASELLQAFESRREEPRFSGVVGGIRLVLFMFRDFVRSVPMTRRRRDELSGWRRYMSNLMQDLRYSVRMLTKSPVFTVAAVVTLALGIGLNATTFSAIHGIFLRPLPGVEAPEELVQLYRSWGGIEYGSNSVPHHQDVRDRTEDVFEGVSIWTFSPVAVATDGQTERIMAMMVSADFFRTFGVTPLLGRAFIPGEEDVGPGAHPVAVLGHGFWESRFGGDPGVLGRTITLNGHTFQVVGVAPEAFKGPVSFANTPLYVPVMMQREIQPGSDLLESRGMNSFNMVARLRDGVTLARAQESVDAVLSGLREEYPDHYDDQLGTRMVLQTEAGIHPSFAGASMAMSTVMMSVVGLLLLIACVNVANLFLARARDRRREMALRLSLGASRGRIVRQLLTESVLFALLAGAAGVLLAHFATRALNAFRPPMDGPWAFNVELDGTVLLFTAAISVAAGILFGMIPALQATKPDTIAAVKGDADDRAGRSRMSSALVVFQMALSLLLLVSAGLFIRSLQGATKIDPGFAEPRSLATAALDPGLQGYDEAGSREVLDRLMTSLEALPEVSSAGMVSWLPLGLNSSDRGVIIPGYEFAEGERSSIPYNHVTEGYLETMGVGMVEGRTYRRSDDEAGAPVLVVNRRFAERFWPGESALGKTVETAGRSWEVIGVVETGKYQSLGEDPAEFMFLPHRQVFRAGMTVVARTAGDPQAVLGRIRGIVREIDPEMPVYDLRTMEDHMGIALLPARLGGIVLGLFGILGLTLAAVGIYGVMAYSVSQRRRELGIRVALGAERTQVEGMVLREGLRLAGVGAVIGLAGAVAAGRLVEGLLYNVSGLDPVAFTAVPAALLAVAALAVWVPARKAARSDPIQALKSE